MKTPELTSNGETVLVTTKALQAMVDYQRIAGALLHELNVESASGLISRDALRMASLLQQRTPEEYLMPLAGGNA